MGNEPSSENLQEIKLYRASESFKNNFWNNQWYPVEENLSFKRICNYWKDGSYGRSRVRCALSDEKI